MNKVVEYMFFGLPVAAFDLHETRVSAGDAGAYAEANSDEALAGPIGALLDDPARRAAMGAGGPAAGARCSWRGTIRSRRCWQPTSASVPSNSPAAQRPASGLAQ